MSQPPGLDALLEHLSQRERHDPRDETVRLAVQWRARGRCEYCLLPTVGQFQVDHVIPSAIWDDCVAGRIGGMPPLPGRVGPDHLSNFAWCCPFCNARKGQRVAGRTGRRVSRLFDPRRDRWPGHFVFVRSYLFIVGVTGIGRATADALGLQRRATRRPARRAPRGHPDRTLPARLGAPMAGRVGALTRAIPVAPNPAV